jgi:hypothetical protein
MMVKLSLVAAFMMTMATLTFAASSLPAPEADVIAAETVASIGTVQSNPAVRQFAIPGDVTPDAAVELMASL